MHLSPSQLVNDFYRVADIAGVELAPDTIEIDHRPAPHVPPTFLPSGRMAVYVFASGSRVLKVGKVGPNSSAPLHQPTLQRWQRGKQSGSVIDQA